MSDSFIRHLVSIAGTLVALLAFVSGYFSGDRGWWWVAFSVVIIYIAIYKLMEV